jgi:hypothetical protein
MGTRGSFTISTQAVLVVAALWIDLCVGAAGCVNDSRDIHAVRVALPREHTGITSDSWGLCSLIGPHNQNPGVWGTDLGFSARAQHDPRLTLLFGDTWASPVNGCQYPPMPDNDMQASLPVQRPAKFVSGPPAVSSAQPCDVLEYVHERPDDVTSWRRVRLFANTNARHEDVSLDMSGLRTPLTVFSDGEKLLALFQRNEPVFCARHADCPHAMQCSSDPNYDGLPIGECTRIIALAADAPPDFCRDVNDCVPGANCNPAKRGVCLAMKPFDVDTAEGPVTPPWYRDDPKRGLASSIYVGAAIWPERPADYATIARFATNRFQNATARSIAYFDPEHPEHNDYRPGYHTLLLWGRNSFVESGGAQALPFLLYVQLDELRSAPDRALWHPHFFAGYDQRGNPAWSEHESDARPIYGDRARLSTAPGQALEWREPEFDSVAQMTLSWAAPLARWVMFYGGDLPAFMVMEPKTGQTRNPVNLQWAAGAIHMRVAPHPWGAAHRLPSTSDAARDALEQLEPGWSSAEPVLTRQLASAYMACGAAGAQDLPGCEVNQEPFRPLALIGALAHQATHNSARRFSDVATSCIGGELARAFQDTVSGDPIGRLYAPNIIDDWTEDVTDAAARDRGEHAVELYWNVSTWNPYQVALFKTRLTTRRDDRNEVPTTALR